MGKGCYTANRSRDFSKHKKANEKRRIFQSVYGGIKMKYTYNQLVEILASYKKMIEHDNGRYPIATMLFMY